MENPEIASFWYAISRTLDRLLACLDGLDEEALNWRPPAEGANSLYVLAVHTLANAEQNILGILGGQPGARDRDTEFVARAGSADVVRARWRDSRGRLEAALATLPPAELDRRRPHPRRDPLTGREVLMVVARHAAEHLGHAELTRDLLRAARGEAG